METANQHKCNKSKKIILEGTCASPGYAGGKAVIIRDCQISDAKLNALCDDGSFIVIMMVPDKKMVIKLIPFASAFIFEMGGRLCHAALLCLEFNKPCLVGVKGVMEKLGNNSIIEVEATRTSGRIILC